MNYSQNRECFQIIAVYIELKQCMEPFVSCFNSHLLYRICVKIFDHELVYSKSYTMTKNTGTIDRQYTEGVELYCQLLLEKISYLREVVNRGMAFMK